MYKAKCMCGKMCSSKNTSGYIQLLEEDAVRSTTKHTMIVD